MRDSGIPQLLHPPEGSRIVCTIGAAGCGILRIPHRVMGSDISHFTLVLLYLCFCVFLLVVELQGWEFPWFSAVLLLSGVLLLGRRVNAVLERQEIVVSDDSLHICKRRPLFAREYTIPLSDIRSVAVESVLAIDPVTGTAYAKGSSRASPALGRVRLPTITHGAQSKTHFAEFVSDEEIKWIVAALRGMIARKGLRTI